METRWIWPFELLDKIGEGGMGVVYRARYVGNNRQVAVKLIPDDITTDTTLLARFERELEVLKQLNHPNIVHCFGGRCESKQRYYAMEYVTGGTLADYLTERKRLSWESAVDMAIQMCEALQYAHEHGVIHRDIKPGNFLMTDSGQLKLSDFGLASVVSERRLTAAGRTVGTILYMAPEQIRGGVLTHHADLYALGCVIYEMLSGNTPYTGASAAEVLQRHLKDPIPHVARLVLECPLELDALVCDLLAKDPELRPASASIVANRLKGILLPGRQANPAEPDLLTGLMGGAYQKTMPTITPLKKIKKFESEEAIPASLIRAQKGSRLPWIASSVLALVLIYSWFGWAHSAGQLHRAEETWVHLLETSDQPTQLLAAKVLGNFGPLHPSTIQKLKAATESPILEVRIAALRTLSQHPHECRWMQAELMRIQKVDESVLVRSEAGSTIEAIQKANGLLSGSILFWGILLTIGAVLGTGGWYFWKGMHRLATA